MGRIRRTLLPWAILMALGLACFARLVVEPSALIVDGTSPSIDFADRGGIRPIGNDATFLFLPHHLYTAKILAEFGHLPRWDGTGFGGRPMVGNPQSGLFYPPVWLAWYWGTPSLLGWLTVGHLIWGGLGLYLLARGEGMGRYPATIAAGIFQASPYLLAQTFEGHYPHVWAGCWIPWAFWAYAAARNGQALGWFALPPILTLAYLTGHPQEWLLLILVLSAWIGAGVLGSAQTGGLRQAFRMALAWLAILAACLLLAAIDLLPAWSLAPWVYRGGLAEAGQLVPSHYSLHPINLFQLLTPRALGGPADYFGHDNYWESVLSIGLVPLLLAAIGIKSHPDRSRIRPWLILVVVALWIAAGRPLGLFSLLYRTMPGMSWFRVPARSLFLANLGAAMLAGYGMEQLVRISADPASWKRLSARVAILLTFLLTILIGISWTSGISSKEIGPETSLASTLEPESPGDAVAGTEPTSLAYARALPGNERVSAAARRVLGDRAVWVVLTILGGLLGLGLMRRGRSIPLHRMTVPLLGLLALGELAWYGFDLIRVAPAESFFGPDPIGEALILLDPARAAGEPLRIRARDTFYVDLNTVRYGIEKTNINDAFQIAHAEALYATLYPVASRMPILARTPMTQAVEDYRRAIRQRVFDRMAVSYLVSDRVESDPPWPSIFRGRRGTADYEVQKNPTALPRAYVVPRAEIVADDAAAVLSRFREVNPREAVLLTTDPLSQLSATPREPFQAVTWITRDPDRPVLEVTTRAPGLLVIADSWMPGWSARVDERPVEVFRGNHAQQVVPLERPGRHRIVLEYQPPGLRTGAAITAASLVCWGTLFGAWLYRKRSSRKSFARIVRPHPRARPPSSTVQSSLVENR